MIESDIEDMMRDIGLESGDQIEEESGEEIEEMDEVFTDKVDVMPTSKDEECVVVFGYNRICGMPRNLTPILFFVLSGMPQTFVPRTGSQSIFTQSLISRT